MRTLQWIFNQADDDHGVSSHMYVPRGLGDDLYIQMEDLGAIQKIHLALFFSGYSQAEIRVGI